VRLPSPAQLKVIQRIQNSLGIKFTGVSCKDAHEFITLYMEKSKMASFNTYIYFHVQGEQDDGYYDPTAPNEL
jgi:hypothetical protein